MKKRRRDFTIVQVMIFIAILAAYAAPKYQGLAEQVINADAMLQFREFRCAICIYCLKNRRAHQNRQDFDISYAF